MRGGVLGMPKGATVAIDDLLSHCARVKVGDEVVILAHMDGMFGGDNLVDPQVIAWIQSAVQQKIKGYRKYPAFF